MLDLGTIVEFDSGAVAKVIARGIDYNNLPVYRVAFLCSKNDDLRHMNSGEFLPEHINVISLEYLHEWIGERYFGRSVYVTDIKHILHCGDDDFIRIIKTRGGLKYNGRAYV